MDPHWTMYDLYKFLSRLIDGRLIYDQLLLSPGTACTFYILLVSGRTLIVEPNFALKFASEIESVGVSAGHCTPHPEVIIRLDRTKDPVSCDWTEDPVSCDPQGPISGCSKCWGQVSTWKVCLSASMTVRLWSTPWL